MPQGKVGPERVARQSPSPLHCDSDDSVSFARLVTRLLPLIAATRIPAGKPCAAQSCWRPMFRRGRVCLWPACTAGLQSEPFLTPAQAHARASTLQHSQRANSP